MSRGPRHRLALKKGVWLLPLALGLLLCLSAAPVRAQGGSPGPRVERLAQLVRTGSDFRVRTQAALALGASKSKSAVEPLCGALSDANTTVRAAAAAALGKLSLGGERCLETRLALESNESVKATIRRSLERFAGGAEPTIGPDTRYYVSLGTLADQSGRPDGQVDRVVRAGMVQAARTLGSFAIAPRTETPQQASSKLSSHPDLKAYHLAPKLPAPRYSDGNLTVKLEVAMFTYPGKALLGAFSVNLTMEGVGDKDPDSEDELISMIAGRAMEKFSQHVLLLN